MDTILQRHSKLQNHKLLIMNFLDVNKLGGMYFEAEDWIFNQNGIKEAMKGLASVAGNNFILSGIKPLAYFNNATQIGNGEGFAVIEGEIFYVPSNFQSNNANNNGNFTYLEVLQTFDPNGLEVFEDGGAPQNTYVIRTAKIATYATAQSITANRKEFFSLKTYAEAIKNNVVKAINDTVLVDSGTPLQDFQIAVICSKDNFGKVTFPIGTIKRILSAGDACQLPVGFRPAYEVYFSVPVGDLSGNQISMHGSDSINVRITTDGIIKIPTGLTANRYALLQGVSFQTF